MHVLDLYDDPSARVLSRHLARTGEPLPAKLASFQPHEPDRLAALPDRLFALVAEVDGELTRKYAMHDPEHLSLSVLYFMEQGAQLPEHTRQKVAERLVEACSWYGAKPPESLQKVALVTEAIGLSNIIHNAPTKHQHRLERSALDDLELRRAQMEGVKSAGHPVSAKSIDEANRALDRFLIGSDDPEDIYEGFNSGYPNLFKGADLRGGEGSAMGALAKDPRTTNQRRAVNNVKTSGVERLELLDIPSTSESRHFALPHHSLYPIDTEEEVKVAMDYFAEYGRELEPLDRRVFAQSVSTRAQDLGVAVSGPITKIAGEGYGPFIIGQLQSRILSLQGTNKEAMYEVLLENLDDTPPIVTYDLMKKADEETGLDVGYGRPVTGVMDPLSAVFGAPEKPIYSWADQGHYVTEEMLRSYSKLVPDMDPVMGEGWSQKFCDDPVKAFDKLPTNKKVVVARLCNHEAFRFI